MTCPRSLDLGLTCAWAILYVSIFGALYFVPRQRQQRHDFANCATAAVALGIYLVLGLSELWRGDCHVGSFQCIVGYFVNDMLTVSKSKTGIRVHHSVAILASVCYVAYIHDPHIMSLIVRSALSMEVISLMNNSRLSLCALRILPGRAHLYFLSMTLAAFTVFRLILPTIYLLAFVAESSSHSLSLYFALPPLAFQAFNVYFFSTLLQKHASLRRNLD